VALEHITSLRWRERGLSKKYLMLRRMVARWHDKSTTYWDLLCCALAASSFTTSYVLLIAFFRTDVLFGKENKVHSATLRSASEERYLLFTIFISGWLHQSHLNNFRPKVISKFSDVRTIAIYRRCYTRNHRDSYQQWRHYQPRVEIRTVGHCLQDKRSETGAINRRYRGGVWSSCLER
jgi:hypothetical protein